ncbi:pyruvate dehydrogenase [acetyl-transferring]-phosphatase 1, mitochondrial [Ischnura elegans]|uniref:pyruvate dehydrogenase [acetyl-transferring]-phosphatase 1, mitochondrial n=1 Tax=Ischnura elegans TaxID=197161 RepID=UPI001ED87ED5|nr:pyruvate dehydrogenase [acetyl-transferring]-phosphatase 1, mitochondrial [Ischnura elegans]
MGIGTKAQRIIVNNGLNRNISNSFSILTRSLCNASVKPRSIRRCFLGVEDSTSTLLHQRTFRTSSKCDGFARLTPQEVTTILRANEYTQEFNITGSVKSYDSNQLASNNPIEDTRSEARCLFTTGMLFGVFDGHGGGPCAQVVAKRLFHYIAASLLPPDLLKQYLQSIANSEAAELIESYNDKVEFVDELKKLYLNHFKEFVTECLQESDSRKDFVMSEALSKVFIRLDNDLCREALPDEKGDVNSKTLGVAMSGAVACVAHVDGPHLHIANVGDCQAVLGVLSELNTWTAKKLTTEHNSDNRPEVERILSEHPPNERDTVIKMDRLLGQLAPLRAFGDFKYKWKKDILDTILVPRFGENVLPPNYYTPPYLTAMPDVIHHRLTPRDRFLVIASDGLWDLISPLQVVRLVGEHASGKVTLSPFRLPRRDMKLGEIHSMLLTRREGLRMKPTDTNAATHLIRNALGGTEYGIDHGKLSQLLTMPDEMVRVFRDDITVLVIYFDSDYLRHCPH